MIECLWDQPRFDEMTINELLEVSLMGNAIADGAGIGSASGVDYNSHLWF